MVWCLHTRQQSGGLCKDAADKIRALTEYPDMENECQPTLDTFPNMFEEEGFTVEIEQVADTVYILFASGLETSLVRP